MAIWSANNWGNKSHVALLAVQGSGSSTQCGADCGLFLSVLCYILWLENVAALSLASLQILHTRDMGQENCLKRSLSFSS